MNAAPVVAAVGLGGNVGDSARIVLRTFASLQALPRSRVLATSALYRTPAWGLQAQADFVNAAASLETTLAPRELLDALLEIERDAGRVRKADGSDRWGPRVLDLDLLLYGAATLDEPGLRVPHPHLQQRAFALVPLCEVLPNAWIPGVGGAREALAAIDAGGIEKLDRDPPS